MCSDKVCECEENECSCPQDCPGECACFLVNTQAAFEAFNEEEGKTLKAITDFEEMPDGTGIAGFDDPLCGGIPNAPDAFPYPNGLDQLNLCVQSNLNAGTPADVNPRGVDGRAAPSDGFLGTVTDLLLSTTFCASHDMVCDTANAAA